MHSKAENDAFPYCAHRPNLRRIEPIIRADPGPQPHLEDGTIHHPRRPTKPDSLYLDLPPKSSQFGTCRPTRLDKIKNFRFEVQLGAVSVAATELVAHPVGAPMCRVAGQSGPRRGFYSGDLKSVMRLPAMS